MIETSRLTLRRFEAADRAPFAAINGDPRVGDWLGGVIDAVASDAMLDRINGHIDTHGWGLWAAELSAERRLIGFIGLAHVAEGALPVGPAVEMGWRLAHDVWGRGLATEGARAALDWAFDNIESPEFIAFTAASNLASQSVMRKIGMVADPGRNFDHPRLAQAHPLRPHVVYAARRR